jgi:hypothetical protein
VSTTFVDKHGKLVTKASAYIFISATSYKIDCIVIAKFSPYPIEFIEDVSLANYQSISSSPCPFYFVTTST